MQKRRADVPLTACAAVRWPRDQLIEVPVEATSVLVEAVVVEFFAPPGDVDGAQQEVLERWGEHRITISQSCRYWRATSAAGRSVLVRRTLAWGDRVSRAYFGYFAMNRVDRRTSGDCDVRCANV
jgi:hypothetical protein